MATTLVVGDIADRSLQQRARTRSRSSSCATSRPARSSISPTMAGSRPAASGRRKHGHLHGARRDHRGNHRHAERPRSRRPPATRSSPIRAIRRPRPFCISSISRTATTPSPATRPMTNTTALPPGFTLGVNAVAVAFDSSLYAGPTSGSPEGLFAALNNSANWLDDDALPVALHLQRKADDRSRLRQFDTHRRTTTKHRSPRGGRRCRSPTPTSRSMTMTTSTFSPPRSRSTATMSGTFSPSTARCRPVSWRRHTVRRTGILRLEGQASHADYEAAIRQVEFSTTDAPNQIEAYPGLGLRRQGME